MGQVSMKVRKSYCIVGNIFVSGNIGSFDKESSNWYMIVKTFAIRRCDKRSEIIQRGTHRYKRQKYLVSYKMYERVILWLHDKDLFKL